MTYTEVLILYGCTETFIVIVITDTELLVLYGYAELNQI